MSLQTPVNALSLPRIDAATAAKRRLLSGRDLERLHLLPGGAPVACTETAEGVIYYFDPNKVVPAPAERQTHQKPVEEPKRLPPVPAGELPCLKLSAAVKMGYYPIEALRQMYYEPTDPAVAFCVRQGEEVLLYDKTTCRRLPLPCAKCGDPVRYRAKLCRACYEAEHAKRRAEGDSRRAAHYHMKREQVLFFDLEMTGLYFHDEVLSVTFADGNGNIVFDSLVRPRRKKKWKDSQEIHGITPEMVKDAPTMEELAPKLKGLMNGAERMIAYGTATDFFHLSKLYGSRAERDELHDKMLDCCTEFSHYVQEHDIPLTHHSLTDAMATLGFDWKGTAHTSAADTDACRMVFEALFPNFFDH